jgi:hypothetical protein
VSRGPLLPERLSELPDFIVFDAQPTVDGWCATGIVHAPEACDPPCPFHAPSAHPLARAPKAMFRLPFGWIVFRACEHLILHPDPDSLMHMRRVGTLPTYPVMHTCCPTRCCGLDEDGA